MRQIRYSVVASLDGYIAGPNGEIDWIPIDPDADFPALFSQFDTLLVGRKTFDTMAAAGRTTMPGMKTIVFSRTLRPADHPDVTVIAAHSVTVARLKASPGKHIWLFGGGSLFRSLAEDGFVDTLEVRIAPIVLGGGTPLAPEHPGHRLPLTLTAHRVSRSGLVTLEYSLP